jgi:hypothetical protein
MFPGRQTAPPQQGLPPPGYAQPLASPPGYAQPPPPGYSQQQQQLPPGYAQPPAAVAYPQQQQMFMGPRGVPMNANVMASMPMAVPQYQPQQVGQYQQPAKPYVPGQRTAAQKERDESRGGCAGFCACLFCGC